MSSSPKYVLRWVALGMCFAGWIAVVWYFNRHPAKQPAAPATPLAILQQSQCSISDPTIVKSKAMRSIVAVGCTWDRPVAQHHFVSVVIQMDAIPRTLTVKDTIGSRWRAATKPIPMPGVKDVVQQLWYTCDTGNAGSGSGTVMVEADLLHPQPARSHVNMAMSMSEWNKPLSGDFCEQAANDVLQKAAQR
jgi:hypothetical protein